MRKLKKYYTNMADRAVRTAAQAAVLSVGVESLHEANAWAVDFRLMGGMAAGGALLSVLTTLGARGLLGRKESQE